MSSEPRPSSPNRRRVIAWGVAAVVLVGIVTAGVIAGRDSGPAQISINDVAGENVTPAAGGGVEPAPAPAGAQGDDVTISLTGPSPSAGASVDLAEFRGKPVVLQIWASWCPGCNDEAPALSDLAKRRDDVAFVGLNFRDTDGEARKFYAKYGWTFPSIRDSAGDQSFRLGLQGTPTTIFLDGQHREVGRIVGATDAKTFEEAVNVISST